MEQQQDSPKGANPLTTALIAGLAWGELFGVLDNLPYLVDRQVLHHLSVSLRAAVYTIVTYCLLFALGLGVIGLVVWGILATMHRRASRLGLFAAYLGLAVASTMAVLALTHPARLESERPTAQGTVRWDLVGLAGPLFGAAVGGILYLVIRRWQRIRKGPRLLRWPLLRNAALALFLAGLLVLIPTGVYQAYRLNSPPVQPSGEPATPERPNIILITVDSLRADHLGAYGYDPEISPHIDALARNGVLFRQAIAQSSWTLPSAASFSTSLYPTELQIYCPWGSAVCANQVDELRTTIAEVLKGAGYRTGAYLSNPWTTENGFLQGVDEAVYPHLGPLDVGFLLRRPVIQFLNRYLRPARNLFGQGYNLFVEPSFPPVDGGDMVNHHARPFLRRHREERFFLWLFYMDAHAPYDPPTSFRSFPKGMTGKREEYLRSLDYKLLGVEGPQLLTSADVPALVSLYDGGIADTDRLIGEIMEELESQGLMDRTLIVLLADHGEEFNDHGGYTHGGNLYQETIRVPLIFSGPPVVDRGRVVDTPVSLLDLLPTLADVAGAPIPAEARGRSLMPILRGEDLEDQPVYSEGLHRAPFELKAMLYRGYKTIYNPIREQVELYDLRSDPGEQFNLAEEEPAKAEEVMALLQGWMQQTERAAQALPRAVPGEAVDDAAFQELLRQAGY